MIECSDISYRYPGAETYVFQNLSLCIPEPGFNALFGPSGVSEKLPWHASLPAPSQPAPAKSHIMA
ncbi:MAG: hypothetical protein KAQ71_05385 [Desulfobulbaceae bacterium]|nr:hypothetical protein [Desulfobulbaceae bacterium]